MVRWDSRGIAYSTTHPYLCTVSFIGNHHNLGEQVGPINIDRLYRLLHKLSVGLPPSVAWPYFVLSLGVCVCFFFLLNWARFLKKLPKKI